MHDDWPCMVQTVATIFNYRQAENRSKWISEIIWIMQQKNGGKTTTIAID